MVSGYTTFKEGFETIEDNVEMDDMEDDDIPMETTMTTMSDNMDDDDIPMETIITTMDNATEINNIDDIPMETTITTMLEDKPEKKVKDTDKQKMVQMKKDLQIIMKEERKLMTKKRRLLTKLNKMTDDIPEMKKPMVEGFNGSKLISQSHLLMIIKTLTIALLYYLFTSKEMFELTKPFIKYTKKIVSQNILHLVLFISLTYMVLSFNL